MYALDHSRFHEGPVFKYLRNIPNVFGRRGKKELRFNEGWLFQMFKNIPNVGKFCFDYSVDYIVLYMISYQKCQLMGHNTLNVIAGLKPYVKII